MKAIFNRHLIKVNFLPFTENLNKTLIFYRDLYGSLDKLRKVNKK